MEEYLPKPAALVTLSIVATFPAPSLGSGKGRPVAKVVITAGTTAG